MLTSQSFSVNKLSQKGSVHIFLIIILLLGIISGVYLVQKTQIFKPKASEGTQQDIQTLTNSLIEAKDNYNNELSTLSFDSKLQKLQEMIDLAKIRKDGLVKELETDPMLFLEHATLIDKKDQFPTELQQFIEENIDVEGTLVVNHIDNFYDRKAEYIYSLETDKGKYNVYFSEDQQLTSQYKIKAHIKGVSIDNNMVVISNEKNFQVLSSDSSQRITNNLFYDIAVVKIKGAIELLPSDENLRNILINDDDSVKNYYQKTSYNRASLNFDLLGKYDIPTDSLDCYVARIIKKNQIHRIDQEVDAALTTQGIDVGKYHSIVVLVPYTVSPVSCFSIAGYFQSSNGVGKPSHIYLFAAKSKIISAGLSSLKNVIIHELGHSFGFGHSGTKECLIVTYNNSNIIYIKDRSNCNSIAHGDKTDPMGLSYFGTAGFFAEARAKNKYDIGWLSPEEVETVEKSGVYKIAALGDQLRVKKAIFITVDDKYGVGGSDGIEKHKAYYRLEYRGRKGLDSILPLYFSKGITILQDEFFIEDGVSVGYSRRLVERGSMDTGIDGGVLRDGDTFYDKLHNLTVKQLSHNENEVTVEIKYGE